MVLAAAVTRFAVWGLAASTALLPVAWEIRGYGRLVETSVRVLLAGEISMFASQYFVDIPLFHRLKTLAGRSGFGVRYNLSTLLSGALSTVLFMFIAFLGTDAPLFALLLSQLAFRALVSLILTPLFSGLVRLA